MMKNSNPAFKKLTLLVSIILCTGINSSYAQSGKKIAADTVAHCGCQVIEYVKPPLSYFPALDDLIKYPSIDAITGWKILGEKKTFDFLFMKNEMSSGGNYSSWHSLDVISPRSSIKVVHPNNTFTLNLTPCANQYHFYEVPMTINVSQKILQDIRDFDYTKFKNTTLGYVHLFLQMSGKRPDQMIRVAINSVAKNYGVTGVNQSITKINQQFQTGIPLVSEKNYRDSLMISGILDTLISKKLRQEQVLTIGFILSGPGTHPPTYDEQYKLEMLFQRNAPYYASEFFDPRKLRPNYSVDFNSHHAVLEISSKIITSVSKNSKNTLPYNEVWVDFPLGTFSSESMLEIGITHVCMPPSNIAGTSITINFDRASLYSDPTQTSSEFDYGQFPQFALSNGHSNTKDSRPGAKAAQYDTLLTRFSGLVAKEAVLKLSYGKGGLVLNGQNVIINNKVIAACITLSLTPKRADKVLITEVNGTSKLMSVPELLAALKKAGLNDLFTRSDQKMVYIYFKKIAV